LILSDVIRDLRRYDEGEVSYQEPSIYAAEPWGPGSEAVVEWSVPKGGLPGTAAKRLLMYLTSVRGALQALGPGYDSMVHEGRVDELCGLLIRHIGLVNADRASKSRGSV
jgi:hypothetical protein